MWKWKDFGMVLASCLNMVIVFLLFYPLFQRRMLGAGDVKLLILCTGFLDQGEVLSFFFLSFLFAGVSCIFYLAIHKNASKRIHYLIDYVKKIVQTGKLPAYFQEDKQMLSASVSLAGPITLGMLFVYGGRVL